MVSRSSRRRSDDPVTPTIAPGARSHKLRPLIFSGLALVALALLALLPIGLSLAEAPVAPAPAQTRAFTRLQVMANPAMGRSHQGSEPAGMWQAPPLAPSDVITNGWNNLFPILYADATLSTTEAWAVGEYGHVVHYTGGAWTNVDPLSMRGLSLNDVKFLSPTDGYIAGGTKVFHYDGTNWNDMSNGLGATLTASRLYPLSDNNIWGVGTYCSGPCLASVVHWDGTTWSHMGPTFTTSTYYTDIAMPSATDGWVVGSDINTNTPYVLHYDGTSWTQFTAPPGATTLLKVSATGVGDIWVISGYNNTSHHIYHYNGTWTTYAVPDNYEAYGISMLSDTEGYIATGNTVASWNGTTWATEFTGRWLYDVSAVSGRVWAAGRAETILMRGSTSTWTMQRGGPTPNFLFAVSTLPSGDAWAVGEAGTIVRYAGGAWSPFTNTLSTNLFGVQMLSPNEVYVVGDHVIARCSSSSCTQVASPPTVMDGLYMTGSDQGWAVGQDGSIWQDAGGTWSSVTSPTTLPLFFVTMDSPTHGWAGGGTTSPFQTVLLEYNGTSWVDRTSTLPSGAPVLYTLALDPGGATGWAAGYKDFSNPQSNAIMRYSNRTWTIDHTSPAISVFNIQLDSNGQAEAIAGEIVGGGVGVVSYHLYNGVWHQEPIPTEWCCQGGLSIIPGVGGWTVGPLGNIMYYTSTAGPASTPTPAPTATSGPATETATATSTFTAALTSTTTPQPPTATVTVPVATPTSCTITFSDVPPGSTFYPFIHCLACLGIINGYPDGTFRPNNNVTRGQLAKIACISPLCDETQPTQYFQDVPPGSTFYPYVEYLAAHGYIGGYACGGPGEPCVPPNNLPYFRPNAPATRGQISKIISNAAGFNDPPSGQQFQDVPIGSTYYTYTYRLVTRGVMSGYPCGAPPAGPCVPPDNLPYFRPNNNATRGQTSKIVANTFFADCNSQAP